MVSAEGVATNPALVEKVQNWDPPRTQKQVRAFLGLSGYYRNYIPRYADVADPLVRLTEARAVFKWTPQCQEAFETLKEKLTHAPILAYPTVEGDFVLDTDASVAAAGAVLSQIQEGQEKVIGYGSKAFSAEEKNYCVTRRELLAIVWAMENYRYYLYGKKFTVRTDHASLKWMLRVKEPKDQLARWIQRLSVFDFIIEHRPGKKHGNANALSRKCFRGVVCFHPAEQEATDAPGTRTSAQELREDDGSEGGNLSQPSTDGSSESGIPSAFKGSLGLSKHCDGTGCFVGAIDGDETGADPADAEGSHGSPGGLTVGMSRQEVIEKQEEDPALAFVRSRKLAGLEKPTKEETSAAGEDTKWWCA